LSESQLEKYVGQVAEKRGKGENVSDALVQKLESRLDNVISVSAGPSQELRPLNLFLTAILW